MHVQVPHRLARRRAVVDADVEPVRPELAPQGGTGLDQQLAQFHPLHHGDVKQRNHVPARDQQGMPLGHRERIADRVKMFGSVHDAFRRKPAKRAGESLGHGQNPLDNSPCDPIRLVGNGQNALEGGPVTSGGLLGDLSPGNMR